MNKKLILIFTALVIVVTGIYFIVISESKPLESNFHYDEVVKSKIGTDGGRIENADKSVVVTFPPLRQETEFVLSFRKSDFEVKSGIRSPVTINISPDVNISNSSLPITIKIKYNAEHGLPVAYFLEKDKSLRSVDMGEIDPKTSYFTILTLHGGDYSWVYIKE